MQKPARKFDDKDEKPDSLVSSNSDRAVVDCLVGHIRKTLLKKERHPLCSIE